MGEGADVEIDDVSAALLGGPGLGDGAIDVALQYDALGRCVYRSDGMTERFHYYDGWRLASVYSDTGSGEALEQWYVHGRGIDEVIASASEAQPDDWTFYHADALGSIVAETTWDSVADTAAIGHRYAYGPYGHPRLMESDFELRTDLPPPHAPMFTGRTWDADLGLYNYRTRHYDPTHGRFLSRDQIGLWGDTANLGNPYGYVGNNPWSRTDPFGLQAEVGWIEYVSSIPLAIWTIFDDVRYGLGQNWSGGPDAEPSPTGVDVTDGFFGAAMPDASSSQYKPGLGAELGREYDAALDDMRLITAFTAAPISGPAGIVLEVGNAYVDIAEGDWLAAAIPLVPGGIRAAGKQMEFPFAEGYLPLIDDIPENAYLRKASGGVDFADSSYLFPAQKGQKNIVKIEYTGSRRQDNKAANIIGGIGTTREVPKGFTWHHLDDYDPVTNTGTLQLVRTRIHEFSNPHIGGVNQYEQFHGVTYK